MHSGSAPVRKANVRRGSAAARHGGFSVKVLVPSRCHPAWGWTWSSTTTTAPAARVANRRAVGPGRFGSSLGTVGLVRDPPVCKQCKRRTGMPPTGTHRAGRERRLRPGCPGSTLDSPCLVAPGPRPPARPLATSGHHHLQPGDVRGPEDALLETAAAEAACPGLIAHDSMPRGRIDSDT